MGGKRVTTEDFIKRAIEAKGDGVYDYSLTEYISSDKKLKIRCVKHDLVFEIAPHDFLRPQRGCPLCGKERMSNVVRSGTPQTVFQEDFIRRAKEVHPEYDYSLVEYKNSREKITVICPKHGEFRIRPDQLLCGQSCRKCAVEKRNNENSRRLTTDIFIKRSRGIHGTTYDYSLVDYKSSRISVEIICPIHGVFRQKPSQHLLGSGCKRCADIATGELNKLTTEEWIARVKSVHGDKYSYGEAVYVGCSSPIKVYCREHGFFWIDPSAHARGAGCSSCAQKGFDKNKDAVLYILKVDGIFNFTGFGITRDPDARLVAHGVNLRNSGCFIDSRFVSSVESGTIILELESLLKRTFPLSACSKDIPGFKTESTSVDYLTVCQFVQSYIENNTKEITYGDT